MDMFEVAVVVVLILLGLGVVSSIVGVFKASAEGNITHGRVEILEKPPEASAPLSGTSPGKYTYSVGPVPLKIIFKGTITQPLEVVATARYKDVFAPLNPMITFTQAEMPQDIAVSGSITGGAAPARPSGPDYRGGMREKDKIILTTAEKGNYAVTLEKACDERGGYSVFTIECEDLKKEIKLKQWSKCEESKYYADCRSDVFACDGKIFVKLAGEQNCNEKSVSDVNILTEGGKSGKFAESLEILFWKNTDCVKDEIARGDYELFAARCSKDILGRAVIAVPV